MTASPVTAQERQRKQQRLEHLRALQFSDTYGVHDAERRQLEKELEDHEPQFSTGSPTPAHL
ncbi:hypothetical protein [Deinococcus sp. SL84]|uniref:hypothetical protein n=1 Tax=Deinococcus sp. SL84 TaxID=2994663 RepID=UPI00227494FB|nr:hypothetical protein [Deinococcus sp. SL84]MCY1703835.1 hypothetical protein [Deinococcus sp. SL84]